MFGHVVQLINKQRILRVQPLGPVLLLDAHAEFVEAILAVVCLGLQLSGALAALNAGFACLLVHKLR